MPRTYATLPRLYVAPDLAPGAAIGLDKGQSNYLINVLRLKKGGQVVVFNGRDGAWLAAILTAGRKGAELVPLERIARQSARSDLWYFFAPVKSARLDYMVQKATEMGAGHIQPVMTRRTLASRVNMDRLGANVIEAAEQCEVLAIPIVQEPVALGRLIGTWQDHHAGRRLVFADEAATPASPIERLKTIAGDPLGLIVGPEGGFAEEERALLLAQKFVVPVSLGPRVLRADTAAVAALAVIQAFIGDWR
ncbi:MAG TPA: 16S rRNA (uracil(1498)-N(3))-methyltransferase [Devosiaceae bacterium]|nr:16S rRNA (uracil(1498)-N(3))-methyltransferase [Devosiaceae bacterium]